MFRKTSINQLGDWQGIGIIGALIIAMIWKEYNRVIHYIWKDGVFLHPWSSKDRFMSSQFRDIHRCHALLMALNRKRWINYMRDDGSVLFIVVCKERLGML